MADPTIDELLSERKKLEAEIKSLKREHKYHMETISGDYEKHYSKLLSDSADENKKLTETVDKLKGEVKELTVRNAELAPVEKQLELQSKELSDLEERHGNLQKEHEDYVAEHGRYSETGRAALELARDRTAHALKVYQAQNGGGDRDSHLKIDEINESMDYKWLQQQADKYWNEIDKHKRKRPDAEEKLGVAESRRSDTLLKGAEVNVDFLNR